MFDAAFWLMFGTTIGLSVYGGYFIIRLQAEAAEFHASIGSPSPFYFATGRWMLPGKFRSFLSGDEMPNIGSELLDYLRKVRWVYRAQVVTWFGAVMLLFAIR